MRYIPVNRLSDGMICGKNLYDVNNQLMLREGSTIKGIYIDRIERLGYQGIYINDEFSSDIVVEDVIPHELRMTAVNMIRDICASSGRKRIDTKTVGIKLTQTKELVTSIIDQIIGQEELLVNLIDLKFHDGYTFFHSVNVAILSLLMGMELNLNKKELVNLGMAALFHDVGKMFIRPELLYKKDVLTPEEYDEVKQHSVYGYGFLKSTLEVPTQVYVSVLQHHEHYDGRGYPNRLQGKEIHPFARIICITDVYDALTANRPYRRPLNASQALDYILLNKGIIFDEELTDIFTRKVAPYPVGTYVRLNSGHAGIVFKNYSDASNRPVVKLIIDRMGKRINPIYVDLKHEHNLESLKIVDTDETNVVELLEKCS